MDPSLYKYPSPLATFLEYGPGGAEFLPPLSDEMNPDGKSFVNHNESEAPNSILRDGKMISRSYEEFVEPLDGRGTSGRGAFDIHIYYFQENAEQTTFAKELYERIRREFPELRIYRLWTKPIGPHPIANFEVNLFTPAQFGAFIPWLVINRGPLSVLIHPNSVDEKGKSIDPVRDHTQRATWMGERLMLDLGSFKRVKSAEAEAEESSSLIDHGGSPNIPESATKS